MAIDRCPFCQVYEIQGVTRYQYGKIEYCRSCLRGLRKLLKTAYKEMEKEAMRRNG